MIYYSLIYVCSIAEVYNCTIVLDIRKYNVATTSIALLSLWMHQSARWIDVEQSDIDKKQERRLALYLSTYNKKYGT